MVKRWSFVIRSALGVGVFCLGSAMAQAQQHAHTHGRLLMDVAVDKQAITVTLSTPLDSFLGFERAPRTPEEQQQIAAMQAQLQAVQQWLQPDPVAQCQLESVDVESAALGSHTHAHHEHEGHGHEAHEAHADIDVYVVFVCAQADKARGMEVNLFSAFPRLQQMQVQIASAQGQFKRQLVAPQTQLQWER